MFYVRRHAQQLGEIVGGSGRQNGNGNVRAASPQMIDDVIYATVAASDQNMVKTVQTRSDAFRSGIESQRTRNYAVSVTLVEPDNLIQVLFGLSAS